MIRVTPRGRAIDATTDRQVPPLDPDAWATEGADAHVQVIRDGTLAARASVWWTSTPALSGQRVGVIGHFASSDASATARVLGEACAQLAARGCTVAIGPMDGSTWRRYRFVVERGDEPPFFLEPDQPDEWPAQWQAAGFDVLASYTSALADRIDGQDPRVPDAERRLARAGIVLRPLDPGRADAELRRIFRLSLDAFRGNFLYSDIAEDEFLAQYRRVLPVVRPELVLLAERGDLLAGYLFAVPDVTRAKRGDPDDTVIVKTVAVAPGHARAGLGSVLVDRLHRAAHALGFRRAIHALMHEGNVSRNISRRTARTIRRYAVYSRQLTIDD